MENIAMVLWWISIGILILAAPATIWQVVIGVRGFFPMKKKPLLEDKKYRFAAIICARNEEMVIGNLVDSLMRQDYPGDKFRVIVVADNCTDATAEEAKKHGAIVYERFDKEKVGKGFALHWVFEHLKEDYPDTFDAAAIFDADNLVAADFLTKMNDALCRGADVASGYRDTKNVDDNAVSASYAIYWLMLMRFFHRARYNWGMSCVVGGTGFAFKMSCIENGWNTRSLGEDSEFSMQQVTAGRKIVPVYDAVVYDEQPTSWRVSARQRFRWFAGCFQCLKYEFPNCLKTAFKGRLGAFDMVMYLVSLVALSLLTLSTICSFVAFALAPPSIGSPTFIWEILLFASTIIVPCLSMIAMGVLVVVLEHKSFRRYWKGILAYPVFVVPMAWLGLAALIHPKTKWKPIVHNKNQSITDMAKPG